jgi:tetratricopeptide (TPR) repeat protein
LVGVSENRIRYWAQTGFVGPSAKQDGRSVYTFVDLIALRAAKELLARGLSLHAARKNLDALRGQLPEIERPLAELRVVSDGERVVVCGADAPFEALTGQVVMDFLVAPLMPVAPGQQGAPQGGTVVELPDGDARGHEAYIAFLESLALEERGDDDGARSALERAIESDPSLAVAHTNLGNLLHKEGKIERARERYQHALQLDPDQPEARFNLANLLDEYGDSADQERALTEWHHVISDCPEFADAHYNLAAAYVRSGAYTRACTHLKRYLSLDPEGQWADRARAALAALDERR